ncbi:MAG: DUF2325 domain-containing protein [Gemmatimonadota bacterium]
MAFRWHTPPPSIRTAARALAGIFAGVAVVLPPLRLVGLLSWPWALVTAPLALLGAVALGVLAWRWLRTGGVDAWRRFLQVIGVANLAPPHVIEVPRDAVGPKHAILAEHPELLAALCLGLRTRSQTSKVLGQRVADGWAVFEAVLAGAPESFDELADVAALHMRAYALAGKRKSGVLPSDSRALKNAADAFRRCAAKNAKGRSRLSCTFEHLVTMYGAGVSSRDAQLRKVAPRVRALLHRKYPHLAEPPPAEDAPAVELEKLRRQLVRREDEAARARREALRLQGKLEEAQKQLAEAEAGRKKLKAAARATRNRARAEAREEQAAELAELREQVEAERAERARQASRFEAERERMQAAAEALQADHDALEAALFKGEEEAEEASVADVLLPGMRILLVGGHDGQLPPLRAYLADRGVQLVHQDGASAADLVAGMDLVVLWTLWVSHPTMFAVKRECAMREVPVGYWSRTSPESLLALVAGTLAGR